nr:uncharacterized protein LOC127347645 [Lolium perenne]
MSREGQLISPSSKRMPPLKIITRSDRIASIPINSVMNYNMQNMNKELHELFSMLKSAEIEIQKEHQVLMVNKTTSFKKHGKPKKGNIKKGGKKVVAPPEKPKGGPKPDTECYYCNGKGHWKRNCPKYLADMKSGLVKKKKGISDIHVIDVYLTGSRTSVLIGWE